MIFYLFKKRVPETNIQEIFSSLKKKKVGKEVHITYTSLKLLKLHHGYIQYRYATVQNFYSRLLFSIFHVSNYSSIFKSTRNLEQGNVISNYSSIFKSRARKCHTTLLGGLKDINLIIISITEHLGCQHFQNIQ